MADIFNEVDEDLRREKLEQLWKKFAPFIIGGAVLFIGGMGGTIWYKNYQKAERIAQSELYQAALSELRSGQDEDALQELRTIRQEAKHGYDLLAGLQEANLLIEQGQVEEGLNIYDTLIEDTEFDQRYRDYAALQAAIVTLDQGRVDKAKDRLTPLSQAEGPWGFTAREIMGLIALNQEDWTAAETAFLDLSLDEKAPSELQARAREYLQILDVKKPKIDINASEPLAAEEETVAEEEDAENNNQ